MPVPRCRSIPMFARSLIAFLIGLFPIGSTQAQITREHENQRNPSPSATSRQEKTADVSQAEKQIFDATNQFRREEKRSEMKENPQLAEAAAYFAKFMASTDKYGHEADGKTPADRAREYKYEY